MRVRLGVLGGLATALAAFALGAGPTYVGTEKCRPCHKPEFETWSGSLHAKATEAAKASPDYTPACLRCHATNADAAMPGVQCEACHGPGSDYWPIPVMFDRAKAVAKGLVMPGDAMCKGCHDGQDHRTAVVFSDFKHDHREKGEVKDAG